MQVFFVRMLVMACIALLISLPWRASAEPVPAQRTFQGEISSGFGYERSGIAEAAETWYAGAKLTTKPVALESAVSFGIHSRQMTETKWFDFRSGYIQAETGTFLPRPIAFKIRYQYERFSFSNASLVSLIPLFAIDTRYFFLSLGCNFRTFSMDDGNAFTPFFAINERQFTFEIGGRCWPRKNLSIGVAMRNFDDFSTGNFATIGYEGDVRLRLKPATLQAVIGYRPSGTIALTATPSGFICRLCARKSL